MPTCKGLTQQGTNCKLNVKTGDFCHHHQYQSKSKSVSVSAQPTINPHTIKFPTVPSGDKIDKEHIEGIEGTLSDILHFKETIGIFLHSIRDAPPETRANKLCKLLKEKTLYSNITIGKKYITMIENYLIFTTEKDIEYNLPTFLGFLKTIYEKPGCFFNDGGSKSSTFDTMDTIEGEYLEAKMSSLTVSTKTPTTKTPAAKTPAAKTAIPVLTK